MQTTHVSNIRTHLRTNKSITPMQALVVYGCARLSSVIEDLRAEGMLIDTVMHYDECGKQYGEMRLRKDILKGSLVQVKRGYGMGLPNWVRRLKAAKVLQVQDDARLVQFIRGLNNESIWVNERELVNAD